MRDLTTWDKSWPGALLGTARGSTGSGDGVSVGMGVSRGMGVSVRMGCPWEWGCLCGWGCLRVP